MASFNAHISFGILTASVVTTGLVVTERASMASAPLIFLMTVISSMLPDIDSDTGIPVRILFGILGIGTMVGSIFFLWGNEQVSLGQQVTVAVGAGLVVYFVVGRIFRYFTAHRGIFHSIPAALIMGLIGVTVTDSFQPEPRTALAIGLSITAGYVCHLVLDELNSAVNLSGIPFLPKKSLGTALKFWSKSKFASISIYGVLLFLLFLNIDLLFHGFHGPLPASR